MNDKTEKVNWKKGRRKDTLKQIDKYLSIYKVVGLDFCFESVRIEI